MKKAFIILCFIVQENMNGTKNITLVKQCLKDLKYF